MDAPSCGDGSPRRFWTGSCKTIHLTRLPPQAGPRQCSRMTVYRGSIRASLNLGIVFDSELSPTPLLALFWMHIFRSDRS